MRTVHPELPTLSILVATAVAGVPLHATTAADIGGCAGTVPSTVLTTNPGENYLAKVDALQPGQKLVLEAGTYGSGLRVYGINGTEDNCIIISGPESGMPAVLEGGDGFNTVRLKETSYVVIRNLELDGEPAGAPVLGDAVKGEGEALAQGDPDNWAHHITLENLYIHGHRGSQQTVGISSKCEAWNWVIRNNVIERAGTGIYLGDSNGEEEFVNGLIEHNLITDSTGYNMQIKHQLNRDTGLGIPATAETIIRHNVFSKANDFSIAEARPNLLVGQFPVSGPGSDDDYLIYGNFFYQNGSGVEPLFQGTGNVAFYANLLVNDFGTAVSFQQHNGGQPQRIRVYQNTVVAAGTGISISSPHPSFSQLVVGNAVFADGTTLNGGTQTDNVTSTIAEAASHLANPDGGLTGPSDRLDLFPLTPANTLDGTLLDLSGLAAYEDSNRDFNGRTRAGTYRGAYTGEGANPGWQLALERKPDDAIFADGFESGSTSAWTLAQ